jgi:hypothetical protein
LFVCCAEVSKSLCLLFFFLYLFPNLFFFIFLWAEKFFWVFCGDEPRQQHW